MQKQHRRTTRSQQNKKEHCGNQQGITPLYYFSTSPNQQRTCSFCFASHPVPARPPDCQPTSASAFCASFTSVHTAKRSKAKRQTGSVKTPFRVLVGKGKWQRPSWGGTGTSAFKNTHQTFDRRSRRFCRCATTNLTQQICHYSTPAGFGISLV